MKITGAIFDMDGTLADTIHSISYFGNKALAEINLPPIDVETYKMLVGNGEKPLVIGLFPFFILLGGACVQPLHRFLFLTGGGQVCVVDVLFGVDQHIQQRLLGNGEQVTGDPVNAHAHGNESAQHQGIHAEDHAGDGVDRQHGEILPQHHRDAQALPRGRLR